MNGLRIEKTPTPVRVICGSGAEHAGDVFLAHGERLQDMLNGGKPFFPLQQSGRMLMIGKGEVESVEILPD